MAKFKKLALLGSAALMTMSFAFGVAACDNEHEHASEWSTDADNHWYACKVEDCTETIGKAAHNWDNGVVTANGEKTVTCKVCGYQKKETVATVLTVGEDTTVKVAAGQATEVAVGADSGSYTLSWTNPKTVVKVGDTEYKKADGVAAEDYRGEADLLWIEDGVKVTVATTDGSAADIVISCKKYSAPQLDCYDYDGIMTMITSAQEPSATAVAAGERGSQFSIYAQNPGWYYVCAIADDGQDDPETPNVVENDYSATITVSANNAYTAPVTVSEGFVAIEVPANSEINVVISHDASAKLDVMAYAMYMVDYDPTIQSGIPFTNALAEVTVSLNYMNQFTQTQDIAVPMASRVYGRIKGVVNPVQVSWNNPSLVFDIAGTVYTKEDCPVTIKRDTFNPTGIYFTAYTKDGSPSMDTITFTQASASDIALGNQSVVVDPNASEATKYIATANGTYTFTIDYDDAVELGLLEVSVNANTLDGTYPDTWFADGATANEDITYTVNVAKGTEIEFYIYHEESTVQVVPFNVSYTAFSSVGALNVPTGSDSVSTTVRGGSEKCLAVATLAAGTYVLSDFTAVEVDAATDSVNGAIAKLYINGEEFDQYSVGNTFTLWEDSEIIVYTWLHGAYNSDTWTYDPAIIENAYVDVTITLEAGTPPQKLAVGSNSVVFDGMTPTMVYLQPTEETTYVITVEGDTAVVCDAAESWNANFTVSNAGYNGMATSYEITLEANEVFALYVSDLNYSAGTYTVIITEANA